MSQSGLLELAHEKLYWPHPNQIWEPSGAGPKVYASLANEKIGEAIRRECQDARSAKIGVLTANPDGDETETPIAIVCEFSRPVSEETIREIYRLAWSFSRTRALITLEPHLLRVWSCCEPPEQSKAPSPVTEMSQPSISEQAAKALQWVDLVSGQFFEEHDSRFRKSGSANQMLLSNLKEVRRQLSEEGLKQETIHDLLARIIFIQFLFQKKDSNGTPALNERILRELHETRVLSNYYDNLPDILENFDDAYQLFRWLNNKFNGDLFPGKGRTEEEREREWQTEIKKVREKPYLNKLAEFVRGDLELHSRQGCLWPQYSFDVIPLDFISSIYEEFVSKKSGTGVHYTPEHIVDFILDGVLPWEGEEWNLKILDPACGSGIFLVKAFQRLIYRWKNVHTKKITPNDLKSLLENNLFGVDIDKEAVRVASFSLYMMMLDNIDPLEYWENDVRFPILRERRLIAADFFREDLEGFQTNIDANTYDLVVGNAPWGEGTVTKYAESWVSREENKGKWDTSYDNIGPLFLVKSASLTKPLGQISMMQPALTLIFNQTSRAFRERLLLEFRIEEIINLSALRFGLFKEAISPTCIITLSIVQSRNEPFLYISPKSGCTNEDDYRLLIEPQDIHIIYPSEVRTYPFIWSTLMWGGRRDFALMRRLSQVKNFERLENESIAKTRQGIIRGTQRKSLEVIKNRRILDVKASGILKNSFLTLKANSLPVNKDSEVHRKDSTDFSAFELPQMIIKMSWQSSNKRFLAVIVEPDNDKGIICSGSYVSVHVAQEAFSILEAACLSYNSKLAVYYLLLSSGRFATYRPEVKPRDLLQVPIPELDSNSFQLQNIKTLDDVDDNIRKSFSFKDSEWVLIEDLFNFTLPDFKGNNFSPGRQKTHRSIIDFFKVIDEPELTEYCEYFLRVIKAGFGEEKQICATIFQEPTDSYLPVRLVAVHLNQLVHEGIKIETIDSQELLELLERLNQIFLTQKEPEDGGIYYQRVARVYDSIDWNGLKVPTVYLIKPDKVRYWTRSMALRDADEIVADIMMSTNTPTNTPVTTA
jgi:type I restriction-modification system DNA methylase subunit